MDEAVQPQLWKMTAPWGAGAGSRRQLLRRPAGFNPAPGLEHPGGTLPEPAGTTLNWPLGALAPDAGPVAQWIEHPPPKRKVARSSRAGTTTNHRVYDPCPNRFKAGILHLSRAQLG